MKRFTPSLITTSAALATGLCAAAMLATAAPASANNSTEALRISRSADKSIYVPATALAEFKPAAQRNDDQIDYTYLDEALTWFVIPMGPSIREATPRPDAVTGTRRIYGHQSRMRLEGNRVAFSYFTDDVRTSLTEYRKDLERVGTSLDLTQMPRNEQLAFWMNLHNVAVIEALAGEYPLSRPSQRRFGSNEALLDDAKLVTISGVELSPRDIRERIVYPNWNDPKVIYGFWRGEIGGPSIQRLAFSGKNLDALLALSAEEFVNSLRGVERTGKVLRVSEIYREAAPFFFPNNDALRTHLTQYARDEVKETIGKSVRTKYARYENDLADLSLGTRDPSIQNLFVQVDPTEAAGFAGIQGTGIGALPIATRPNAAVQRIMRERRQKLDKAIRRGIRTGEVVVGDGEISEEEAAREVE